MYGYIIFLGGFMGCIYQYLSWLLHLHWGNHMIAPVPSYDCPSASEATLKGMGKIDLYQ